MKKVLISGINGQDGGNMLEYLLKNTEYILFGTKRTTSDFKINNKRVSILNMDLENEHLITEVFKKVMPDYFINFAAQSSVGKSWNIPKKTFQINTISVIHILEVIRTLKPSCRFYSAGSSEEFGEIKSTPQTLNHPLNPISPYGASKCATRHIVRVYRESYNIYAIHCILFNHEGSKRGKEYVTRKITSNLARIKYEIENNIDPKPFQLGNIYVRRDWSDSEDFIEAVWIMLNKDKPKEYMLSSNKCYSVKDFIEKACEKLNLIVKWNIDYKNPLNTQLLYDNLPIITISKQFYRILDSNCMRGNSESTFKELKWKPKSNFDKLVEKMVKYDYDLVSKIYKEL